MTNIKKAIINTLAYSDIFNYPLTASEIHKYLTSRNAVTKERLIKELAKVSIIEKKDNLYFFTGRENLVPLRKMRNEESEEKIRLTKRTVSLIGKIPTVKFLAISGSIAANNAKHSDDIDLFIITKKNKLWTTRLVVVLLLLLLFKKRPKQVRTAKNKICPNMFLDESSLTTKENDQNIYTAREITQLKVMINKQNTYEKYLSENAWITKLLPNTKIKYVTKNSNIQKQTSKNKIERLLYKAQSLKMKKTITNETIKKNRAHFHPNKTNNHILYLHEKKSLYYNEIEQKNELQSSTRNSSKNKKQTITPGS